MPPSSIQSDAVFVPRLERSRRAQLVWLLQHGVAGLAVGLSGMPGYVKCVVLSGVAVSLWMARPERSPILRIAADGTWGLPRESLSGLRLLPGSTFTRSWARLRLAGPDGRCRIRRIWYDVFSDDDRRRLLIALRERRHEVR